MTNFDNSLLMILFLVLSENAKLQIVQILLHFQQTVLKNHKYVDCLNHRYKHRKEQHH